MEIRYGRKRSGIRRQLEKKLGEWLGSIEDEGVREAARRDVICTGGAIASMLLGEKVNDYDLYFRTIETTKAVAEYYVKKFKAKRPDLEVEVRDTAERIKIWIPSKGVASENGNDLDNPEREEEAIDWVEDQLLNPEPVDVERYRPIFMSANAITLSDKVQIVTRFYGEPEDIHDNYDFEHAKCYWDHAKGELSLPARALECLLSRTLVYRGSLYPVASIFRMKKFIERGWRISAGEQLKIMWQISELDFNDFAVLEEQLTGVDAAYMWALLCALRDIGEPEKFGARYVAEIIDRIFS